MGHIYRACQLLIVWLGEEIDDSDLACSLIVEWGEAWRIFVNEHSEPPQTVEDFRSILTEVGPDAWNKASWDALDKLFERAWWRRIWVLQEFAKARLRVFMCGDSVFDSNTLVHAWAVWDGLKESPTVLKSVALDATPFLLNYTSAQFTAIMELWEFDTPLPPLDFLGILYRLDSINQQIQETSYTA